MLSQAGKAGRVSFALNRCMAKLAAAINSITRFWWPALGKGRRALPQGSPLGFRQRSVIGRPEYSEWIHVAPLFSWGLGIAASRLLGIFRNSEYQPKTPVKIGGFEAKDCAFAV